MKYLIIFFLFPFFASAQERQYVIDTIQTTNGFLVRYVDVTDSLQAAQEEYNVDRQIQQLNEELLRLQEEIDLINSDIAALIKKKEKIKKIKEDKDKDKDKDK